MNWEEVEIIFKRGLVSNNPEAILAVADAFYAIGQSHKARVLRGRAYRMSYTFGAMARGTPIAGTNGAVIPPGRYWIDVPDNHLKTWIDWLNSKPEVHVEKSELVTATDMAVHTLIFTIASNASNYGLSGVFFPTQLLGFPTIADSNVRSKADIMNRPAPMTRLEAMAAAPGVIAQGLQGGVQYVAETAGKVVGSAAKGVKEGSELSTTQMVMIGIGTLVGLFMLNRVMMPHMPI
jgi:hypothetical protein